MRKEVKEFIQKLKHGSVEFKETMQLIGSHYRYQPTPFKNGTENDIVFNEAGQNEGSCKVFAFAKLHHLSELETLKCFGHFYHKDVLGNPDSETHPNIRTFMKYGWSGIRFDKEPLIPIER